MLFICALYGFLLGQDKEGYLIEVDQKWLGNFEQTHGRAIDGFFSPYANEYLKAHKIPSKLIIKLLFNSNVATKTGHPRLISSYPNISGNWTYFQSDSVVVYEALKVQDNAAKKYLIILYNTLAPESEPSQDKGWRLAVIDEDLKLKHVFNLNGLSNRETWFGGDMTYTDLNVRNGKLVSVITDVYSGSGGFPEQGFAFYFTAGSTGIKFVKTKVIKDGSQREWLQ